MRDPWEGLTAEGMIRTGVRRDRVPSVFEPILAAAVVAVTGLPVEGPVELELYGSVATGEARPGLSDVDLLTIGISRQQAKTVGRQLSRQFAGVCRGVEIGAGRPEDFRSDDSRNTANISTSTSTSTKNTTVSSGSRNDERYGNRVFLRHYCVPLYGPNVLRTSAEFPGDDRAARGFNGDIGQCLDRWRRHPDVTSPQLLGRRVARKTLLAVAGLVSVHDGTWTIDRGAGATRWSKIDPPSAAPLTMLSTWSSGERVASAVEIAETLAPHGIVATVVAHFAANIGLWAPQG